MDKYRIISVGHNYKEPKFKIQYRLFFIWGSIYIVENKIKTDLSFKSYAEAEKHMIENYFHDGDVTCINNVYRYKSRRYFVG